MELGQIEYLFYLEGYDKIPTNLPEYVFFCRRENQGVTVVFVVDYHRGVYISEDQYAHMKKRGAEFFRARGGADVHMLSLILSEDTEAAKRLCAGDSFCWMIDKMSSRLIIHENQTEDFYGWKAVLEDFLAHPSYDARYADVLSANGTTSGSREWSRERIAAMPWVNICLVAVNVVVFLICTFTGDLLYNKGAFGLAQIMEDQSYYRIITSMFLHADIQHLFNNMIILYFIGEIVEKKIGHIPYIFVYFLSGIAGNIFSVAYELLSGEYYSSIGASGAVFGVEGALLYLVIINHGRMEHLTAGRLVFAILFSLYSGLTSTDVNNAAHIGGLLMGFAAAVVAVIICPQIVTRKDRDFNES